MAWLRVISRVALLTSAALAALAITGAAGAAGASITLTLSPQNNSGISGSATLTEMDNNQVKVTLKLDKAGAGPQPAHIHPGSCANLDPKPQWPLKDVVNGASETVLTNVKLTDITDGKHAINVHKSAAEIQTYVACGNIAAYGQAAPAALMATGDVAPSWLLAGLSGILGVAGVASGVLLRRRPA